MTGIIELMRKVLHNVDELFEREELSAAPDVGWPDCFNSGVFVYRPSLDTYDKLIQFAIEKGSFDGGDQGLLNLYFSDWAHKDISRHLPFIYNMCSTACYSYLPAFKQFGANAKIIHFIGSQKPWLQYFNTETRKVQPSGDSAHLQEILQRWWDLFCSLIHPHLSPAMQGQSQQGMTPSYFPPQYDPPPNPTASADDYENTWDPWDEYDQKVAQATQYISVPTHSNQNQSFESLNTNANRVADQPTIHSQPQSHDYNTCSNQNNSYYQPPLSPAPEARHHFPRASTPPPHHQPVQVHIYEPQHDNQIQSEQIHIQSQPQYHHIEEQPHQHHQENKPEVYQHHDTYIQTFHTDKQKSFSQSPERSKSPDHVPILPKDCEATTTVSNDMSLSSTIEDNKSEEAGLAGAFSKLTLGVARTPEQDAIENVLRKQAWELGNIDYLGKDSFDNIWSKITETLSSAPAPEAPAPEAPAPEAPASEAPAETLSQTALQEEATSEQCLVEPPSDNKISDISKIDSPETSSIVDAQKDFELAPQENIIPANKKSIAEITQSTEATKSVAVRGSGEVSKLVATPQKVADIITKSEVPAPVVEPIVEPSVCPIPPKKEVGDTPVAAVAPSPTLKLESSPTQEIPPLSESPVVFKGTDVLSPVNAPPENATTTVVTFASVSSPALPIVGPADTAELPSWNFPGTPKVIESSVTPSTITETKAPFTEEEAELPRISTAPSMVKGSESPADPSGAVESHKTKITEATPPVSPGTPPVERAKPALAAEAGLPDTPPPTEGSSTPTPPPRKTDKPKKTAAKPKK